MQCPTTYCFVLHIAYRCYEFSKMVKWAASAQYTVFCQERALLSTTSFHLSLSLFFLNLLVEKGLPLNQPGDEGQGHDEEAAGKGRGVASTVVPADSLQEHVDGCVELFQRDGREEVDMSRVSRGTAGVLRVCGSGGQIERTSRHFNILQKRVERSYSRRGNEVTM